MVLSDITGDSGIFIDGDWIESKDQDPSGDVRLIQLADIGEGSFKNKSDRHITSEKAKELNCTYLKKGDILIARLGEPLCKACIFPLDGKYITAVDVAIFRTDRQDIFQKYLVYLLNSPWFKGQVKLYESGTTRKRISRKNLNKIEIPVPSFNEQHRIVSRIEELFSSLDNALETLRKTKEQLTVYRQAVLKELLSNDTWKKYTLGEIVTTEEGDRGKKYPKRSDYRSEGYCLFLSAQNVRPYGWNFEDTTFLTKEKHEELHSGTVQEGDVVITTRGTLGNVAVLDDSVPYEVLRINSCMLILRCNKDIVSPYYLSKFIMSPMFRQLIQKQKSGTAQPQIPANQLRELTIRVPALEEQQAVIRKIESRLSVCDSIEQTVNTALAQAEAMRQSILKEAFEGRL